jgi:hypothetical protein
MNRYTLTTAACALGLVFAAGSAATAGPDQISFDMVVSAAAKACLPIARAHVNVVSTGTAEDMTIFAAGLPANTEFDFFVIQVPLTPFGLSWYQGDLHTDDFGQAVQHFRGRFNDETFIVAPAPRRHRWSTPAGRSRMRQRTRRLHQCTPSTWASGSTRRQTLLRSAARAP